jgi:hypothetical protein
VPLPPGGGEQNSGGYRFDIACPVLAGDRRRPELGVSLGELLDSDGDDPLIYDIFRLGGVSRGAVWARPQCGENAWSRKVGVGLRSIP